MTDQLAVADKSNNFDAEARKLAELRLQLEKTDKLLVAQLDAIFNHPSQQRGMDRYALQRAMRLAEQLTAGRGVRLATLKTLMAAKAMRRDGAIKIATADANINEAHAATAINAELLRAIQGGPRGALPGADGYKGPTIEGDFHIVEGGADDLIAGMLKGPDPIAEDAPDTKDTATEAVPDEGVPAETVTDEVEFDEGDLVCTLAGEVYVIDKAGEPQPFKVDGAPVIHADAEPPHAILPGGFSVPLVDLS